VSLVHRSHHNPHRDRGASTVELVLTMPALLLAVLLTVQVGQWQHAKHVALAAAQEGARAARQYNAAAAAGGRRAEDYLTALAPTLLRDHAIGVERTATTATVRVRGRVAGVLPWPAFTVDEVSSGPVERFVPDSRGLADPDVSSGSQQRFGWPLIAAAGRFRRRARCRLAGVSADAFRPAHRLPVRAWRDRTACIGQPPPYPRRVHRGAQRPAALVGQRQLRLKSAAAGHRRGEVLLGHRGQVQLRPPEHVELAVRGELAPAQVHEPLAAPAVHERPAEVHAPGVAGDHIDGDREHRVLGIAGHQADHLTAALHPDIHRLVASPVPARQPAAQDPHRNRRHVRSTPAGRRARLSRDSADNPTPSSPATPPRPAEAGTAAVEFVILAPMLAALLLFVAGLGRIAEARGQVQGAAREAARAASLQRTQPAATTAGQQAARAALAGQHLTCATLAVTLDVTGYRPGGQVTATVRCTTNLARLGLAGFPATHTYTATAVAAIESWRGR
jgi:Flp pilus assembly protein TadG